MSCDVVSAAHPNATPQEVKEAIVNGATEGKMDSTLLGIGTPNKILYSLINYMGGWGMLIVRKNWDVLRAGRTRSTLAWFYSEPRIIELTSTANKSICVQVTLVRACARKPLLLFRVYSFNKFSRLW